MAARVRYHAALWAIISALAGVGCGFLLRSTQWSFSARLLIALIPVLPMAAYCVLVVRIVRGLDELQTRIYLEGALYALLGTALIIMATGLLTRSGVLPPVTLAAAWPWLWIAAFLFWGTGTAVAGFRYR